MAVGAIEPQFYAELVSLLGLDPDEASQFDDPDDLKQVFAARFKEKTQAEWTKASLILLTCFLLFFTTRGGIPMSIHKKKGRII